ncbi:MAG: polysaccharide biosynthesis/export family protein [Terracidiphilus sp.]|jgi:polysaccharide export outer membrane protein
MRFVTGHWLALAAVSAILSVYTQACAQDAPAEQAQNSKTVSNLAIGPGDMLDITVYDVPELTLKVRVGEDGSVTLPLVGALHCAGLSVSEMEDLLVTKLVRDDYVKIPQVSILISEFATQSVSVGGEVNQPGIYPLPGPHTLFDAITAAGGLTQTAGDTITIVHKSAPGAPQRVTIGNNGGFHNPPGAIQPGDMITVSKAGIAYVVGEVNKPGGFLLGNNTRLTVVQAIALAGGQTVHARMKHVSIVRRRDGVVEITTVDLKQMMRGREQDIPLQPDDILYVPNSGVRTATDILQRATIGAAAAAVLVAEHP